MSRVGKAALARYNLRVMINPAGNIGIIVRAGISVPGVATAIAAPFLVAVLSGCGQKGALYLPQDDNQKPMPLAATEQVAQQPAGRAELKQ